MAKYQPVSHTKYTNQTIQNMGFDERFMTPFRVGYKYNPAAGTMQADENPYPAVMKVDEASSSTTYIGIAAPGTSAGVSEWQIKRLDTNGTVISIEFADGDKNYDNEWDERTNLSYS